MPQEQYVVASNTKVYLLLMLQVCCDSGFILLVKKEVLFIRVLESCLRSPHPTSSVFYWSSPPAFPILSALHNIAHCMVVGTCNMLPYLINQGLSYIDTKCCFHFRLFDSKYNWLFNHATNKNFLVLVGCNLIIFLII